MSRSGCNLIGDGLSNESENSANAGRCVCGPAVPWCPNEPHPYTFATRHECKLNLAAKIAYGELYILYIYVIHTHMNVYPKYIYLYQYLNESN